MTISDIICYLYIFIYLLLTIRGVFNIKELKNKNIVIDYFLMCIIWPSLYLFKFFKEGEKR